MSSAGANRMELTPFSPGDRRLDDLFYIFADEALIAVLFR